MFPFEKSGDLMNTMDLNTMNSLDLNSVPFFPIGVGSVMEQSSREHSLQQASSTNERQDEIMSRSCFQCEKAHSSCDRRRPCSRCNRLKQGDKCFFPPLKKRGRKPTKPRSSKSANTSASSQGQSRAQGRDFTRAKSPNSSQAASGGRSPHAHFNASTFSTRSPTRDENAAVPAGSFAQSQSSAAFTPNPLPLYEHQQSFAMSYSGLSSSTEEPPLTRVRLTSPEHSSPSFPFTEPTADPAGSHSIAYAPPTVTSASSEAFSVEMSSSSSSSSSSFSASSSASASSSSSSSPSSAFFSVAANTTTLSSSSPVTPGSYSVPSVSLLQQQVAAAAAAGGYDQEERDEEELQRLTGAQRNVGGRASPHAMTPPPEANAATVDPDANRTLLEATLSELTALKRSVASMQREMKHRDHSQQEKEQQRRTKRERMRDLIRQMEGAQVHLKTAPAPDAAEAGTSAPVAKDNCDLILDALQDSVQVAPYADRTQAEREAVPGRELELLQRCAQQSSMSYLLRFPMPLPASGGGWTLSSPPVVLFTNQLFNMVLGYKPGELSGVKGCSIACVDTASKFCEAIRSHAYHPGRKEMVICFAGHMLAKCKDRIAFAFTSHFLYDRAGRIEYALLSLVPHLMPESGLMDVAIDNKLSSGYLPAPAFAYTGHRTQSLFHKLSGIPPAASSGAFGAAFGASEMFASSSHSLQQQQQQQQQQHEETNQQHLQRMSVSARRGSGHLLLPSTAELSQALMSAHPDELRNPAPLPTEEIRPFDLLGVPDDWSGQDVVMDDVLSMSTRPSSVGTSLTKEPPLFDPFASGDSSLFTF
eukprot:CAMPEP_0174230338 /NCGR_PEP_ID=MMETSP0417-20130205/1099_1 /TAXON_ID=242541 /ORGANISM="Mayorella sp, Strain BSH-02190019" /LENGTH=815 /DNA_ID=CAMNT_0015307997 /DNA_START=93 /DNA_END=2540 /DNA_ORIENTATION=-